MVLLRDAVAKGYTDIEHVKKDTNLDALRDREDFAKVVAELEARNRRHALPPPVRNRVFRAMPVLRKLLTLPQFALSH